MSTTPLEAQLSSYQYALPAELIAQHPAQPRDSSRLFVLDRKKKSWEHRRFTDLPEYLDSNDLIVANNTLVMRARLKGRRIRDEQGQNVLGGETEFLMLEQRGPKIWEGLFHASAKASAGLRFEVPVKNSSPPLRGTLLGGVQEGGTVVVEFDQDPLSLDVGELPLPHYIRRDGLDSEDEKAYQTLYSKRIGSAAAPTAGLHFSASILEKLAQKKISWKEVTLHVGIGTFRPVKAADIREHKMHQEWFDVSQPVAEAVTQWKAASKRILAVGTTSVRTLESAWKIDHLEPGPGRTELFIRPGAYEFQVVDRLLTNFHLPASSLLMLVCAFAGQEFVLKAYEEAVKEKYRFFSYGDAMLVL